MKKELQLYVAIFIAAITIFYFPTNTTQKATADINPILKKQFQEKKSEALDALQFFTEAAAFPNKDIPPQAYQQAYNFYKNNFADADQFLSTPWQNIGPKNVGGRTLAIAIDPVDTSIVWLGSASGGLWKSTTGGIGVDAWTYIPTGFSVLGVSSIAIDPNNHNTMYIGTGETYSQGGTGTGMDYRTTRGTYGIGILKSIDGGTTWTQSLNWNYQQNQGIWDIAINPKKTNTIYVATTEGVYRSKDAGANWNLVLNQKMVLDIELNPVDTNIVFAGVGNMSSANKGLYRSSDGGNNWSVITSGLPANTHTGRITISCYQKNPAIVYATVYDMFATIGVYRSTNKGVSWAKISGSPDIASYQGWYAKGLCIKPDDSSKVLLGGVYLYKYRTGGAGFTNLISQYSTFHADIHTIIVNPKDPEKVYIATDGGLFRSNNFTDTLFYECTDGYVTTQLYIGSVSASNPQIGLAGAQDNYSLNYMGSPYWGGVIGGDGCYNAIDPNDDAIQYAAYQYLNVYKTNDNWQTNYQQILQSQGNANDINNEAFLAPFILCPSNTNVIYAGSDSLEVSTNGGGTFTQHGSTSLFKTHILTISVSSTSIDTLYLATAPDGTDAMQVFRTIDGGINFTNITGTLPNRFPRRISVNPQNSKEIYITYSGFGTGHIYKSIDAGNTWTNISSSLPDIPFHVVTIDPLNPTFIYAGSDMGIFYSLDGGSNWNSFNAGLAEAVMVYDIVISPANRYLYAFTHGHGVYMASMIESSTAGIKNNKLFAQIALYPNPASDVLTIRFVESLPSGSRLSIYTIDGKMLENEECSGTSKMIIKNVSQLPAGNYILSIKTANSTMSKRFIIAR